VKLRGQFLGSKKNDVLFVNEKRLIILLDDFSSSHHNKLFFGDQIVGKTISGCDAIEWKL
jgi:hypothetical protein